MKNIIVLIVFLLVFSFGYGQTALAAGEIAITGFNADNPDQFTFVLLTDVTTNTTINFTDRGWFAIGGFRANEGTITWTATSDLTCGTEITITDNSPFTTSSGTVTDSGGLQLAITGDQILAYQGPDITPAFIYAVNFDGAGWSDAIDANTTAIPLGLTDGINAVYTGDFDNGSYDCSVTTDAALILQAVSTNTNWTLSNAILSLGGCGYTCVACASSTTWAAGGWNNGPPDINTSVTISADYNTTVSGANEPSFSACSLIIGAGARLTIDNTKYVEVQNRVTVNGQLFVETQGAFVQNSDTEVFTDNSTNGVLVNKSTTFIDDLDYTYWSSPVNDDTVENALSIAPANRRFLFNAVNFVDNDSEIGNSGVFNPGVSDDIDDDGNDWQQASGIMTPGIGYASTGGPFGPFAPGTQQFTFTGAFNNGVITTAIVNNSGGVYNDWNFIGNPYPSAIDTNIFFTVNSGFVNALYLWSQATPLDTNAPGSDAQNFSAADYATISASGVNTAGGDITLIPNDYVPSGQGFFIEALAAGNITFNNSMRVTGNNDQFFRVAENKNVLWINLTSDNGIANQIAIAHLKGATDGNDGSFYDVKRNVSAGVAAILYSTIDGSNDKFVIQGKAVNSLNENEVITIGFKTTIDVPTIYTLSIAQLEGDFLNGNPIYLKDNLLNTLHNLKDSDYNFTSTVGEFNTRFEIVFNQEALSLGDQEINNNDLSIIELQNGNVQFKLSDNLAMSSIQIIDLQGRILYNLKAGSNSKTYNLSSLSQSVYIANVTLSNGYVITKKAVKRY